MGVNKVVFGAVSIMDISDSTVTPDKLAKGATAYDKSGEKITGTMEAATDPKLQEKTVTPATSAQSVTPDSGYDGLSKVTVNAMPTATQATPSISVNSSGLITASATQTAGYVAAGTKSATKQLTTQAAKTITPSTSSQTAVAAGRYTTGAVTVAAIPSTYVKPTATKAATTYTPNTADQTIAAGTYCSGAQTIKGDANLVAGNIKSGVSIFGVAGSYEGSGGGSGGGMQIATGSVTPTSVNYYNNPISVTGLGFKPKMVCFYSTGNVQTTASSPFITKAILWYDGMSGVVYINAAMQSGQTYVPTVYKDTGITASDDGFVVKSVRSDYQLKNGSYEYIACG